MPTVLVAHALRGWARQSALIMYVRALPITQAGTKTLMHCALCLQFLQRSRVLALYRTVLRGTRRITDHKARDETRLFARQEIERHRHVQDLVCQPLVPSSPPARQPLSHGILTDKATITAAHPVPAVHGQDAVGGLGTLH